MRTEKRNAVRRCKIADQLLVQIGGTCTQTVVHVGDAEPFNAKNVLICNKVMRQADGVQASGNSKQQPPKFSVIELLLNFCG